MKTIILRRILVLQIFIFSAFPAFAQPPCATNPIANDYCESATPICNLNGYCGNTSAFYTVAVSPTNTQNENNTPLGDTFCGGLQNNSWLKFIADSNVAIFRVWSFNCNTNWGIQMQIYETTDCYHFTSVSNCMNNGHPDVNEPIIASNLTPGNVYFFMIDGTGGDVCDYVIACDVGVSIAPAVSLDQTICYGDSAVVVVTGGLGYQWSSNPVDPTLSGQEVNPTLHVKPAVTTTYTVTVFNQGVNSFCTTDTTILNTVVTVNNVTPQLVSLSPTYCSQNNGSITISGTGGIGTYSYLWNTTPAQTTPSLTGLSSGTYTVTVTSGTCSKTASYIIQEIAGPVASIASFSNNYCNQQNGGAVVQVTGGTPPFTYQWNSNPIQTTNNLLNVSGGIYTITVKDNANCTSVQTVTVTDVPGPDVALSPLTSVCVNSNAFTLTGGTPAGGTYSGTAVTGNIFVPSTAGVGTFQIMYKLTDAHNCSDSAVQSITVKDLPLVTFPQMTALCANSQPVTLNVATPPGGTYSGTGVSNGIFTPSVSGAGSFVITYTYLGPNGCTNSATQNMAVFSLPNVALVALSGVCVNAQPVTLTGGVPSGGTFSGPGVTNGIFDPSVTGIGTFSITYTIINPYGCTNSVTKPIKVYSLPTVTLSPLQAVCENNPPYLLQGGLPSGGTYSGIGVTNNYFDPSVYGTGYAQIVYSYMDSLGCVSSDTQNILIKELPVAVFQPSFNEICVNGDSVILSGGSPVGGSYVGPGVISGVFYPSVAGADTIYIGYSWSDTIGCSDTAYQPILVRALPELDFPLLPALCLNDSIYILSGATPSGGTYSGTGVSYGSFDPALNGVGDFSIRYTYTDEFGCTDDTVQILTVNSLPLLMTMNGGGTACDNTGGLEIGLDNSQTGVWYYLFVNGQLSDDSVSGTNSAISFGNQEIAGYYTVKAYDTTTGCYNIMNDSILITLLPHPSVNIGDTMYICDLPEIVLDAGTYADTAFYEWQDGSDKQTFSVIEPGIYWVKVFLGNCYGTDSIDVEDCSELIMPNVFTPNGDQKNDRFLPEKFGEILEYKIDIFDRWGKVVYNSTDLEEGWDGTNFNNGSDCAQGCYYYVVTYVAMIYPQSDRKTQLSGSVTLLR